MPRVQFTSPSKDYHVRAAVVRRLLDEGVSRGSIRHELTLDTASSGGRVDMALLLDRIIGIELKSASDTLHRLQEQIRAMRLAFDGVWAVADIWHEKSFDKAHFAHAHRLLFDRTVDGMLSEAYGYPLRQLVPSFASTWGWGGSRETSLYHMASLLWRTEACAIAEQLFGRKFRTREAALGEIREAGSLKALRPLLLAQLRNRPPSRWETAFWARFDSAPGMDGAEPGLGEQKL
jgi:hypothetical protein